MGSMLGPNRIIAEDVKSCTCCCYIRCATLIVLVGGNALAPNRRNSVPFTVRTSRQRSCTQRLVVCNNWDLERLDLLNGQALGCYQHSVLIVLTFNPLNARPLYAGLQSITPRQPPYSNY